jgi:hypothetical protein
VAMCQPAKLLPMYTQIGPEPLQGTQATVPCSGDRKDEVRFMVSSGLVRGLVGVGL